MYIENNEIVWQKNGFTKVVKNVDGTNIFYLLFNGNLVYVNKSSFEINDFYNIQCKLLGLDTKFHVPKSYP